MLTKEQSETQELTRIEGEIQRETEKAILFDMSSDIPYEEWFPKSQLYQDEEGAWFCCEWIAKDKGLV